MSFTARSAFRISTTSSSLKTALLCSGLACFLANVSFAAEPQVSERLRAGSNGNWVIAIRPLDDSTAAVSGAAPVAAPQPSPETPVSAASGTLAPRMTYAQALATIPFSRAEYEANPSYRHDSAMELMFGAMRPTTVVRQTVPYFSRYPDYFRNRFQVFPYMNQSPTTNMYYLWSTNAYTH